MTEENTEEVKVSDEVALNDYERWVEAMDLDLDEDEMDSDDRTRYLKIKRRILKAISNGSLVINSSGVAEYTPSNPESKWDKTITFYEPTGEAHMAMDGVKNNHDVTKARRMMGQVCREHPNVFNKLVGTDYKICQDLFLLLMD